MAKIRVVNVHKMVNAVELTVNGLEDANWIVQDAQAAGFDAKVKPQTSGLSGTNLQHVLIHKAGGGVLAEIQAYLEGNAELDLPKN